MGKRFTETEKWEDAWFRRQPPINKLVFMYFIDRCNNAGFYELDTETMAHFIGCSVAEIEGAIKGLDRGLLVADGWVWVKNFLRHQKNETLNPDKNPAHRQIVGLLNEQKERFGGAIKGLTSPIGNEQVKVKVEDTDARETKTPTLPEVQGAAAIAGVPPDIAEVFFLDCEKRPLSGHGLWTDRDGIPIRNWRAALKAFAMKWQANNAERASRSGAPPSMPVRHIRPPQTPDHE